MTSVFISWSGELSKNLAEELRKWIPGVLQFARPYFTPNDIEKGTKWSSEISKKLTDSDIGIICLTRENFEKPWILFEAGALSKGLDSSKVCSILFNMDESDLSGPLTTFQTTKFEKNDFKKLVSSINESGGDNKLSRDVFEEVFDMWWPRLEASVNKILDVSGKRSDSQVRTDREILEEILSLSRLSSRKSGPSTSREVPQGLISSLTNTAQNVLREARNFKDRDLLKAANEIIHAAEYLNTRHSIGSNEMAEQLQTLVTHGKDLSGELTNSSSVDEEIPF